MQIKLFEVQKDTPTKLFVFEATVLPTINSVIVVDSNRYAVRDHSWVVDTRTGSVQVGVRLEKL